VRLTLRAAAPRRKAAGGTRAEPVPDGRAGGSLDEARGTRRPTGMAFLHPVLAPREVAFGAAAALPHGRPGAVDGHVGACWALVTDQLGARVRVGVLIVAG